MKAARSAARPGAAQAIIPEPRYDAGPGYRQPYLQLPFDELAAGARAAGHNRLTRDPDSDFARRMWPFVEVESHHIPPLGVAAAFAFLNLPPEDAAAAALLPVGWAAALVVAAVTALGYWLMRLIRLLGDRAPLDARALR